MRLLSSGLCGIYMTVPVTGHPVGEKDYSGPVTEHFSRSKPGTVPRIPASLFSSIQDFESVSETIKTGQSKSSDQVTATVKTKFPVTESEHVDESEPENSDLINNKYNSGTNKDHQLAIESFTAYPSPPSSFLLSDLQPTTQNIQDFGSVIEKVSTNLGEISDQGNERLNGGDIKAHDTVSEQTDSKEPKKYGQIKSNDENDIKKSDPFSIEEDVNSFKPYPLPPSSFILSNSQPKTNNPLDNLKDFPAWKNTEISDIQGNHELEIEDNKSIFIVQLAVESEQNQHSVNPAIVINHSPSPPATRISPSDNSNISIKDESVTNPTFDTKTVSPTLVPVHANYLHSTTTPVSPTTAKIAFSDISFNISEIGVKVNMDPSSSHNISQFKFNASSTLTSEMLNDTINDEVVMNLTFDSETMTTVIAQTIIPGNKIEVLVEPVTTGTLSIVEVHSVDVAKLEETPQTILHNEDDDRSKAERPSGFLSTQASPLANDALAVRDMTEITPQSQQQSYEYTTNFTNTEDHENMLTVEKFLLASGNEDEESKELETMYYSDIYAISTIQPVHEVTFYATTEEIFTEDNTFVKEFNLLKEERGNIATEILTTSELYELTTVIPSKDVHKDLAPRNEESFIPKVKNLVKSIDDVISETKDYPSTSDFTHILNPKPDYPNNERIIAYHYGVNSKSDIMKSKSKPNEDSSTVSDTVSKSSPSKEKEDLAHPLLTLMKIQPHAMKLLIKPLTFYPNTKVRV